MQRLINTWEKFYYTEPLLLAVLCLALVISIQKRKKYKILKSLPVYIIALLIVFIFTYLIDANLSYQIVKLGEYIDYGFTIVEIVIFSLFFYKSIDNLVVKQLIIIFNIAFIIFSFYMFFAEQGFYQTISQITQSTVYTIEGAILLMICVFYFIELFKKPIILNLKNEPAFWISTGVLFFFACTLPYSILENYISRNYSELYYRLYSIFYIFYILLFLMIIRAYLCKAEKTI